MITLYHNPSCSKSRQTFDLLKERDVNFEVILYLKQPIKKQVLLQAISQLGESVMRKNEPDYKQFIEGKNLDDSALADAMITYPKTIERPLVIKDDKMAIGRPIENVIALLNL